MSIKYGFFNSSNGDRLYNAADIGRYLHGIVSSGVFADSVTSLQVLAGDGMTVEVQPGRAMLDCHYMENDEPLALTLSAGGAQARVDAIVAVLDMNERLCDIVVKEGTPGASPVAPNMYRTDAKKEYMLASVRIPALASSITQENITDTRPNSDVCGWVKVVNGKIGNDDGASCAHITATIGTGWTADATNGGYKQTVAVADILETDTPIVDVVLGADVDANAVYLEAWACVTRISTADGEIVLYANSEAPASAFTIQMQVVR